MKDMFWNCLQLSCQQLGRDNPVLSVMDDEPGWVQLVLNPGCMLKPSATAEATAAQGFVDVQMRFGGPPTRMWGTTEHERPLCFYHGTSPESLLAILFRGRIAAGSSVGKERCSPDGVYGYANRDVSTASSYVQAGVQLTFRPAYGTLLTAKQTSTLQWVPQGCAARMKRGAYNRHQAAGAEWVFHEDSCEVLECRVQVCALGLLATAAVALVNRLPDRPNVLPPMLHHEGSNSSGCHGASISSGGPGASSSAGGPEASRSSRGASSSSGGAQAVLLPIASAPQAPPLPIVAAPQAPLLPIVAAPQTLLLPTAPAPQAPQAPAAPPRPALDTNLVKYVLWQGHWYACELEYF